MFIVEYKINNKMIKAAFIKWVELFRGAISWWQTTVATKIKATSIKTMLVYSYFINKLFSLRRYYIIWGKNVQKSWSQMSGTFETRIFSNYINEEDELIQVFYSQANVYYLIFIWRHGELINVAPYQ